MFRLVKDGVMARRRPYAGDAAENAPRIDLSGAVAEMFAADGARGVATS